MHQLASSSQRIACLPEDDRANPASFLQLLPTASDGCILLLDDNDMRFTLSLIPHIDPHKIISTTRLSTTSIYDTLLTGVITLWGMPHPCHPIISNVGKRLFLWSGIKCVLWFPDLEEYSEDLYRQKNLVKNFFEYMAIRILGDSLYEVRVIVTMNNIQFSQMQVISLSLESIHVPFLALLAVEVSIELLTGI